MKHQKKITSMILALVFLLTPLFTFANYSEQEKLNFLIEKHNLTTISVEELPEGIQPIEVNSAEELERILSNIEADLKADPVIRTYINYETDEYGRSTKTLTKGIYRQIGGAQLSLNFTYQTIGNSWAVDRILSDGWNLSGFTLGMGISDSRSSARLSNTPLFATANVNGTTSLNNYFLINGVIQISSSRWQGGFDYRHYNNFSNQFMSSF